MFKPSLITVRSAVACVGLAVILLAVSVPARALEPLTIYSIDVEGGGATLFVTPSGESLLVGRGGPFVVTNGRNGFSKTYR
jgi:hypothetical protein